MVRYYHEETVIINAQAFNTPLSRALSSAGHSIPARRATQRTERAQVIQATQDRTKQNTCFACLLARRTGQKTVITSPLSLSCFLLVVLAPDSPFPQPPFARTVCERAARNESLISIALAMARRRGMQESQIREGPLPTEDVPVMFLSTLS